MLPGLLLNALLLSSHIVLLSCLVSLPMPVRVQVERQNNDSAHSLFAT